MAARVTTCSPLDDVLLSGPLIGRDAVLESLIEAVRAHGRMGVAWVQGPAGIGKTRLLAEVAARFATGGATVLYGRCEPQPLVPYEPFVQALRATARIRSPVEGPGALAPFLDVSTGRTRPRVANGVPELGRLRFFDTVVSAIARVCAKGGGLLIVDDLHWARTSTLRLLTHLLGPDRPAGLLLLGAARSHDPDLGAILPRWREPLESRSVLRLFELGAVDAAAVGQMVAEWTGSAVPPHLAQDLCEQTGGNPLVLRATLTHLRALRLLFEHDEVLPQHLTGLAREAVPAGVMSAVGHLLERVDDDTRELLSAGAVLGRRFSLQEARLAVDLDLSSAVRATERASRLGLIRDLGDRADQVEFDHGLVRAAVLRGLSSPRRAMLHLAVAQVINSGPLAAARSAELADHFGEALPLCDATVVLRHARRAAADAERQYAFDEVVRHVNLALRALDRIADDDWEQRFELLMALGMATFRAEGPTNALAIFARAADLAESHGDRERLARAGLGAGLERYLRFAGADETALVLLDRAYAAVREDVSLLAVNVLSTRLLERGFIDSLGSAERQVRTALARAARVDEPEAELLVRVAAMVVLWHPAHTGELLDGVDQLARLARAVGRVDLLMHIHCTAYGYALELNRRQVMDAQLATALRVAAELRVPIHLLRAQTLAITGQLVSGEFADAEASIATWRTSLAEADQPLAMPIYLSWSFIFARERGTLTTLIPQLESMLVRMPSTVRLRALMAEAYARVGDVRGAAGHLDVLAAERFADVHQDMLWLSTMAFSASAAALLGDRERASWLYALLEPYAGRNAIFDLAAADRPASQALGMLARLLGRLADACTHFQAAADGAAAFGAAPWHARALLELGITMRRAGSRRAATEPLREALDIASRCGCLEVAERARRALVALGARPRRTALQGPGSLTPAELRVARLAAAGNGNPTIARTLEVTLRTVETHLTHAYRKLGISSRDQLTEALRNAGEGRRG